VTNDLIVESHQALVHHFEMRSNAPQQGLGPVKDGLGPTIMESFILSNAAKQECASSSCGQTIAVRAKK
jgi:hypothetical protein